MLFMGDLSYADNYPNHDNVRWDTWGRFVERSNAYQPWIWVTGNHEIDYAPHIGETKPFKPFTHRYHVPYKASNSTSPHWYSVKIASAHIIVLSSYSAYGKYTPQTVWLQNELAKVNRSETPWLIVLLHSPWYNSYNYHYMEGETMRVMYESLLVQYKVDLVFAGHVHAYERSVSQSLENYWIVRLANYEREIPEGDPRVVSLRQMAAEINSRTGNKTECKYSRFRVETLLQPLQQAENHLPSVQFQKGFKISIIDKGICLQFVTLVSHSDN